MFLKNMPEIKDWIIAARPKTLTASILPVVAAHILVASRSHEPISIFLTMLALISAVFIQIGTNYFNDVVDFKNGVDNQDRSGPRRLLQVGLVNERQMGNAAHICFALALVLGIPLVIKGGVPILLIGLFSILLGYGYSAAPIKLAYRGLAEPFVILFFGVFAVGGIELIHLNSISTTGVLLGLQFGLLASVLLVINNIRDEKEDAQKNKKTLVARFGRKTGQIEVGAFYLICLIILLCPYAINNFPFSFLWILPAVFVLKHIFKAHKGTNLNQTLGLAALTHALFGIGTCLALF